MNFDNSLPYTTNETGKATSPSDYLTKIRDFVVNVAGFTEETAAGTYYVFSKDGVYYSFNVSSDSYNSIDFYTSESLPASFNSGASIRSIIPFVNVDIENYHLYYNGRNLLIITEYDVGFYAFCSGGKQTAIGINSGVYHTSNLMGGILSTKPSIASGYEAFTCEENTVVYIDGNECYNLSNMIENSQVYTSSFVYNSRIKLNNKGLLFSNILSIESAITVLEFSDFFFSGVEYYATEESFSIGSKIFKFFPNYEKVVPRNYDTKTKALGLCVRTA